MQSSKSLGWSTGIGFVFTAIMLVGLLLRVFKLEILPLFYAESDLVVTVSFLLEDGFYSYLSDQGHGPLPYYFIALSESIFGHSLFASRLPSALFAVATVFLVFRLREALFRGMVFSAAILTFSPIFVSFSRMAIHETYFVFFHVMFTCGFVWLFSGRNLKALAWIVVGALGLLLVKETWLISFLVTIGALFWLVLSGHILRFFAWEEDGVTFWTFEPYEWFRLILLLAFSVLVFTVLYSGFFFDWSGLGEFWTALPFWVNYAMGEFTEIRPIHFYFRLYALYDWVFIFALVLSPFGLLHRLWSVRYFSALFLFGLMGMSVLPHKSEWLILSFSAPAAIMLGQIIENRSHIFSKMGPFAEVLLKSIVVVLIVAGAVQSVRWNFLTPAAEIQHLGQVTSDEVRVLLKGMEFSKIHFYGQSLEKYAFYKRRLPYATLYSKPPVSIEDDVLLIIAENDFKEQIDNKLGPKNYEHRFIEQGARGLSIYKKQTELVKK